MGTVTDEPLPHTLAIRQDFHVITQTLSREHTTFVTLVTLGDTGPTDSAQTTTTAAATDHHQGPGGLTNAQIGAIVGSVVGFFILAVLVVWCCCCQPRPRPVRHNDRRSYYSTSSAEIIEEFTTEQWPPKRPRRRPPTVVEQHPTAGMWPPRPTPAAERIPGGPKFPTYRAIPIPNPRRTNVPQYRRVI